MSTDTTPARRPALQTRGLTKSYGAAHERAALAPLDLSIEQGQLVALVGHNGSGKTTLLRMAAGLLDPSGGSVEIDGSPRGSIPARAALAYLSDHPTFYDDLSLLEHLEFVARMHGVTEWHERAVELTTRLGIEERLDKLPNTFSRGLRQKAAMIVDEPFVGLDSAGKSTLLDLFDEAHRSGATVVVATHELGFVSRADRLIALADGALRYDGPPGETDVQQLVFHT
jgi:ABC-2 type transport system ATP-binding protein